uniref:Uncharacterized protein n=1 Tax=Myoviridae sp. ctj994 TaxID=2825160 RepID=A0A8S5NXZ1_9CAUD|nr:MAG TPA: hypothetical protein [Myoviridae sp. ctj994]
MTMPDYLYFSTILLPISFIIICLNSHDQWL